MELRSFEAIVTALNDAGADYIIVGGIAVNAHGYVRMTRDIDIVLRLEEQNIRHALNALIDIGYRMALPVTVDDFASPESRAIWRDEKNMLVLKLWSDSHRRTPVDIFINEPFDFSAELSRTRRVELAPHLLANIVSLDTLIQMKRQADRPQDRVDIEELQRLKS